MYGIYICSTALFSLADVYPEKQGLLPSKYKPESAQRTTIITVFLTGPITTTGYSTKTALQKLSET